MKMVRVNDRLGDLLDREGRFGESYSDVIVRLIGSNEVGDRVVEKEVVREVFVDDSKILDYVRRLGQTMVRADKLLKQLEDVV